jgi:hypothetical protein
VPFFVRLPGQRAGRVDDGAVRTVDVLPTIARGAGVTLPWRTDGMPADERAVDPEAPIRVSHAGEPALTAPLGSVLAQRAAREDVEARLLRDGVYAIGPRPELIGRRVDDAPAQDARPPFLSGEVPGLRPGAELAVAVDGRVEATTRVYRDGDRSLYTALVPGDGAVTLLEIRGDELRPIG